MYYLILAIIIGLVVGSFLNVCIYRIPLHQEIVYTPSHCMKCKTKIKWYDLIPLFSYIVLKGKCRNCGVKLSVQYPLIEVLNACLYGYIIFNYKITVYSIVICILASSLIVISVIDYKYKKIPNSITLFLLILGIIYTVVSGNYVEHILGIFAVSLPLFIINIVTGGKMGMGDVKLMASCGLILGAKLILLSLFLGSIIGSIIGYTLIVARIIERKQMVPFGPFLSIGMLIAAFWGDVIINWYISLII